MGKITVGTSLSYRTPVVLVSNERPRGRLPAPQPALTKQRLSRFVFFGRFAPAILCSV
jgi:hypothetical protein